MTTSINRDEWLKAVADAGIASEDDQEALTVQEYAELFSIDRQTADRQLKKLEAAGKARKTTKRAAPHGRRLWYVAYRLT